MVKRLKQIASLRKPVIKGTKALGTSYSPGTGIFIGLRNIQHIRAEHYAVYKCYKKHIATILSNPDYVGIHPKDRSIQFIKEFPAQNQQPSTRILIAVRPTKKSGVLIVRTMFEITEEKLKNYLNSGHVQRV